MKLAGILSKCSQTKSLKLYLSTVPIETICLSYKPVLFKHNLNVSLELKYHGLFIVILHHRLLQLDVSCSPFMQSSLHNVSLDLHVIYLWWKWGVQKPHSLRNSFSLVWWYCSRYFCIACQMATWWTSCRRYCLFISFRLSAGPSSHQYCQCSVNGYKWCSGRF